MGFISVRDVKAKTVRRIPIGIPELDWLYGCSSSPKFPTAWGLPEGKTSLWAAERGVGKSRAAIEVCRVLARKGYPVMYFQSEVDKGEFVQWVNKDGGVMPSCFYMSEDTTLSAQVSAIKESGAQIAIVDSINTVQEFGTGSTNNIKLLLDVNAKEKNYTQISRECGCHIILLSQLTKSGEARGSTTLSHLVDIEFTLLKSDAGFNIEVGKKHRYGRTGSEFTTNWIHNDQKVICSSNNRLYDDLWCITHNTPKGVVLAMDLDYIQTEINKVFGLSFSQKIKRFLRIKR